jgi:hypothetical protein
MDNAAWKSARIGFASTAASQVTALMRPSALDAMHSAVLRVSPVQELAANVSRLAVGVGAQPALSAMSTLAERIAPAQELVTSMSRLAVGIAGEPALSAMSTLAERIVETIVEKRGLCRAPHKPRYVEFRIMRSSFLDDGNLRAGS